MKTEDEKVKENGEKKKYRKEKIYLFIWFSTW